MDESTGYSSCFYIFLFLVLGKVLPTVEKYSPYEGGLANTVGWLKEGFLFPDKVTDRDTVKTGGLYSSRIQNIVFIISRVQQIQQAMEFLSPTYSTLGHNQA